MKDLVFLCHRIPYPPNKGDKIRSFNILKQLSEYYRIHLAAFVDDPTDWQYQNELNKYCASLYLVPLNKKTATIKSAKGLLIGKPLTVPYFYSSKIKAFVETTLKSKPTSDVFIFSSSMAQYVQGSEFDGLRRVIDFVDVDSDKWRQYAEKTSWPMSWVYRREARLLEREEKQICIEFDKSVFVSPQEAACFKKLVPESICQKVDHILNGVDTIFFHPSSSQSLTRPCSDKFIAFTGAMDYWANVDAVMWFADKVWPQVRKAIPQLKFYIVGGKPHEEVSALAQQDGIVVTGRVDDIRPYITHALMCIAPMRIARGIQNKVLEAMASGKATVLTTMAADGIELPLGQQRFVCDDPKSFLAGILDLVENEALAISVGKENREKILSQYHWDNTLSPLLDMFDADNKR